MPDIPFILEQVYEAYRPLMYAIAYRMLASAAEAEDVVQDIFAELAGKQDRQIEHPKAYLTQAVTNRCINLLKSSRLAKTAYPGPWLPEPAVEQLPGTGGMYETAGSEPSPEEKLLTEESVSYAMLVAMEKLNPAERAVFILRETLGFSYREIAGILGRTEAACRQNGSRAMRKLESDPGKNGYEHFPRGSIRRFREDPADESEIGQSSRDGQNSQNSGSGQNGEDSQNGQSSQSGENSASSRNGEKGVNRVLAEHFLQGARTGDFSQLISRLSEDVRLYSDGGGKTKAALNPIFGLERILLFLEGVGKKGFFAGDVRLVKVNGQAGLASYAEGRCEWTLCWSPPEPDGKVREIYLVVNPEKLDHLAETF